MKEFLIENWGVIVPVVMALAWSIVRLTPTKKDDRVMAFIQKLVDLIPDKKKGGGKHNE